jgi:hypothetical protein
MILTKSKKARKHNSGFAICPKPREVAFQDQIKSYLKNLQVYSPVHFVRVLKGLESPSRFEL